MTVVLDGLFFNGSGFAEDNMMLLNVMRQMGVDIKIVPRDPVPSNWTEHSLLFRDTDVIHPNDIYVCNLMAGSVRYNPKFRTNIARTTYETDRLPKEWVLELNKFDEIWVMSSFNTSTFTQSGVTKPIYVVPGTIDYNAFEQSGSSLQISLNNRYTFLSVFDWQTRKGYSTLLSAYLEEFTVSDNVCLLIKTYQLSSTRDPNADIDELIRAKKGVQSPIPPIYVFNEMFSKTAMVQLYRVADAFVLPSHGEGWGRPLFESMAMGLPTIGTSWGGQTDFMTSENSFPIAVESWETITNSEFEIFEGQTWAIPSVQDLRNKMRYVFEHPTEARQRGSLGARDLRQRFNASALQEIVSTRLEKYDF